MRRDEGERVIGVHVAKADEAEEKRLRRFSSNLMLLWLQSHEEECATTEIGRRGRV